MNNSFDRGNLVFMGTIGVSQQKDQVDILPGKYDGLLIVVSATNDTGDDWELSDGAKVQVLKEGSTIVNMDLGFLAALTNMRGGTPGNSSTTAGACQQSAIVPFETIIQNAVVFEPQKANAVIIDLGSNYGDLASGTVYIYGRKSNKPENYTPFFFDTTLASFSGQQNYKFPVPNLLEVYGVGATAANVDNLQLFLDNDPIDNSSYLANKVNTNIESEVETALTYFKVSPITLGKLLEGVSNETHLFILNSSATAVYLYVFSFNPPQNYDQSVQQTQNVLAKRETANQGVIPTGNAKINLLNKAKPI